MAKRVKLLGFAAADTADALEAALGAVPGPAIRVFRAGALAVLAQDEAAGARNPFAANRSAALKNLVSVQKRLEVACLHGPFLPADPAHAVCLASEVAKLLADAADSIGTALAGPGTCHQWDVVLRWQPEAVVAAHRGEIAAAAAGAGKARLAEAVESALARDRARREAALLLALARVSLAAQPAGAGTTETGVTALVPAGGEAVLEQALCGLDAEITAGASADLRGPLPPISFAAVRLEAAAPGDVAQAWHALALPDWVDEAGLRRHWHACAARLHPDHGATESGPIAEAGAAFRLLRGLIPPEAPEKTWSLPALQRRGAMHLRVPPPLAQSLPSQPILQVRP